MSINDLYVSEVDSIEKAVSLEKLSIPLLDSNVSTKTLKFEDVQTRPTTFIDNLSCDGSIWRPKSLENEKRRKRFKRIASMPGDVELRQYVDRLIQEPEKLTLTLNDDTGECILHLLAKEGKVEIIHNLFQILSDFVEAWLRPDKLGWSAIMAATKAEVGSDEIIEMFLCAMETKGDTREKQNMARQVLEMINRNNDSLFTLVMSNETLQNLRIRLFLVLMAHCDDSTKIERIRIMFHQLLCPNSCELTSFSMRQLLDMAANDQVRIDFSRFLYSHDFHRNNVLMELARHMKDDALREILTHGSTNSEITHSLLMAKNDRGQTLMTLIEVNRKSLSESLPLILKREYGCHRRDIITTEICLSEQLETSASAAEIILELHQLEPKTWCQIFGIWLILFFTSLTPNIGLAMSDIFSDVYLTLEYYSQMQNDSYVQAQVQRCIDLKKEIPVPLEAYATCLNSSSKFFYTIAFLIMPLIFYSIEFVTLQSTYEPTGLYVKLRRQLTDLRSGCLVYSQYVAKLLLFLTTLMATLIVLVLWQPVTALCKFYRDGRYESTEGKTRVARRKIKRSTDLAASRGELIEVCIEAVFEPMVQGYIIFPSIIDIVKRLSNSVSIAYDKTLIVDFQLKGIETAQIFSISISIISLAWCFSEYYSVRKNMLLDITVSPISRIIMFCYMLLQVIARLLAFVLFSLYWGPGNFYPLMIFVFIHMLIASLLHVIFSEDICYWRCGQHLKFIHNVLMNSFASIYFHNYLRFDEMPLRKPSTASADELKSCLNTAAAVEDAQHRPGLHISTFLRQLMFDTLYIIEYIILLSFGLYSSIEDLLNYKIIFIFIILFLSIISLVLKVIYYNMLHVWSNVILWNKKLIRREMEQESGLKDGGGLLRDKFIKYVFVSRNTWILGYLRHIETTVIVLPKRIIEAIKGRGQDLEYNFTDVTKQVRIKRLWNLASVREIVTSLNVNKLFFSLLAVPIAILFIVINILIIALLLIVLVMTIPVAVMVFIYNLKSGFRSVELGVCNDDDTLELPPLVCGAEKPIFNSYPLYTLAYIQKILADKGGFLDMSRMIDVTVEELEVFSVLLLSLSRKRYRLQWLSLDNCELTDEKLIKLAPLIAKFERVSLNGCQKMSAYGWKHLSDIICHTSSLKLRVLELKISKNDIDVMRFRHEILLEEFKDNSMSAESLGCIAQLLPRLERVYLDDAFSDSSILDMIRTSSSLVLPKPFAIHHDFEIPRCENIVDAWRVVAKSISDANACLQLLSLPGCSLTDQILSILCPSGMVRINILHLGRNLITNQGWTAFCSTWLSEPHPKTLHLSLNALTPTGSSVGGTADTKKFLLNAEGLTILLQIAFYLDELDLSGQYEIGTSGWEFLITKLQQMEPTEGIPRLKLLVLRKCKIKSFIKNALLLAKPDELKIEFGDESDIDSCDGKFFSAKYCCC